MTLYSKVICGICNELIWGIVIAEDDTTPSQINPIHEECVGKDDVIYNGGE